MAQICIHYALGTNIPKAGWDLTLQLLLIKKFSAKWFLCRRAYRRQAGTASINPHADNKLIE
jgi:hypothetical protein